MTDAVQKEKAEPDPGAEEQAEGDPGAQRPQDQGKGPGSDPSDRPPAEGARDDSDD